MVRETPLTVEGRARLRKVAEYKSWGYDAYHDALREELGACRLSKCHVYELPCFHEGRRHVDPGYKDTYVLKVCSQCLDGEPLGHRGHEDCFLDNEVGIWNEAIRRGDHSLFCPTVAADRRQGWMIMEHCDYAGVLSGPESRFERSEMSDRAEDVKRELRARGWRPTSTDDMDVEVMALDGRLVVIDYEKTYHEDWMFDPLCWSWSEFLRRDTPHTATTNLAVAGQDPTSRVPYEVPEPKQREIVGTHYSNVASRAVVENRWRSSTARHRPGRNRPSRLKRRRKSQR